MPILRPRRATSAWCVTSHLPEREIMTGIGAVAVRQPRVRDREGVGGERMGFSPTILPPYAGRTKSLEVLIPILYLKGISSGDFEEILGALLGKDAGGLSASPQVAGSSSTP
jgi:putative transposase